MLYSQAVRSNTDDAAVHRQLLMRESTIVGSVSYAADIIKRFSSSVLVQMKQPWPSTDHAEAKEIAVNNRTRSKIAYT